MKTRPHLVQTSLTPLIIKAFLHCSPAILRLAALLETQPLPTERRHFVGFALPPRPKRVADRRSHFTRTVSPLYYLVRIGVLELRKEVGQARLLA
jgi:hypothetical protein